MKEIWSTIKNFPDYKISNLGRVIGMKGGFIGFVNKGSGYVEVILSNNKGTIRREFIHTLVLETFVSDRPYKNQVRHLDGIRVNNNLSNLCWGTAKENHQDAIRHGTHSGLRYSEENHFMVTIKRDVAIEIKHRLKNGDRVMDIVKELNVKRHTVNNIKFGLAWRNV